MDAAAAAKRLQIEKAQNFMRQYRDPESRELKKLSANQFMDVWSHYDKDGNGYIEGTELDGFLREFVSSANATDISPEAVTDTMLAELKSCFMEAYDDNQDGKIDIRELAQLLPMEENFLLLFRFDNPLESSVEFMKIWREYDTDNSGYIEADELKNFLRDLLKEAKKINDVSEDKLIEYTDTMTMYNKNYPTTTADNNARFYYAVNKDRVLTHNTRYAGGIVPFQLAVNQFSDLRFVDFAARYPPTTEIPSNGVPYTTPTPIPQASFDYASQGFTSPVQDQGQVCNSGWAYAAATALQIFQGTITGNLNTAPLSAQNFIDCTGGTKACVNQVPQVAFDYLTVYLQKVFPLSEYKNRPTLGQGMCLRPPNSLNGVGLTAYSNIPNGNDALLKSIVNYVAPVVIKYNPGSFEMMHYKQGVFTQPAPTQSASHPMTVVGFGTDLVTNLDYWLVQNSWGTTWGESGFIRIHRNPSKPITISAIFPSN